MGTEEQRRCKGEASGVRGGGGHCGTRAGRGEGQPLSLPWRRLPWEAARAVCALTACVSERCLQTPPDAGGWAAARSTRRARGAGRAADVMLRAAGGAHVSAATAPRSALPVRLTPGSARAAHRCAHTRPPSPCRRSARDRARHPEVGPGLPQGDATPPRPAAAPRAAIGRRRTGEALAALPIGCRRQQATGRADNKEVTCGVTGAGLCCLRTAGTGCGGLGWKRGASERCHLGA